MILKTRAQIGKAFDRSRFALRSASTRVVLLWLVSLVLIQTQTGAALTQQPGVAASPQTTSAQAVLTQPAIAPAEAASSQLMAKSLGGAKLPFRILLPVDYATNRTRRYPVLYLLHGLFGDENDWWTRSSLAAYATRYRLIIVTPGVGDSWYANSATAPQTRYEDVIVRDLIPYIDAQYRTLATREGRAIAGLSMGGLGAIKFALRYPEMFAFAGSFSGAFDVPRTNQVFKKTGAKTLEVLRRIYGEDHSETRRQNDVFALLASASADHKQLPYLYLATGKDDPLPSVLPSNPRFVDALRASGAGYEYHERPGTHDWHFWDAEVKWMLDSMSKFVTQMQP